MSQKFLHSDLGYLEGGRIVQVTLRGNAANVRLLDGSNLSAYRNGRDHRYYGGLAKQSPVRLQVPHSGHWHVVVDFQGLRGQANVSVTVLPQALPPIQERPLSSIPSLVRETVPETDGTGVTGDTQSDVFISYASEDRGAVAAPLAESLQAAGLSVWYDDFELKMGASLRRSIDRGIAGSRFGVVILSPNFFRKDWPQYELDGLVTRSISKEQTILPVWHDVTKQEVIGYSPSLADKVARSTATHTIDEIAQEILEAVQPAR
ncbi:MAG: DUF1883 domain-containing protein [Chloroflexota bacterium]|nr:DUF1883 domain-containing protein [Chloroflexota bacterium]